MGSITRATSELRSRRRFLAPARSVGALGARVACSLLAVALVTGGLSFLAAGGASAPSAASVSTGGLYGWGYDDSGSLGNPNLTPGELYDSPEPVSLPDGLTALSVATSGTFTLALASNGSVYAWGDNTYGELGNSSVTASSSTSPVLVDLPPGVTATGIAVSASAALAIGSDGNVYAWGDNTYGQLGQGDFGGQSSTPVVVDNPTGITVTAIAAGFATMMELTSTGAVYLWGYGLDGELGDGGYANSDLPQQTYVLDGDDDVQQISSIAAGQDFCVVATTTGAVYTWGYDGQGELGDFSGDWTDAPHDYVPNPIEITLPAGDVATQVSAGAYNGYALTTSGTIDSWGAAAFGSLGDGPPPDPFWASTPVEADGPPGGGTYTQVAAGANFVSALTSTGAIASWGQGADGQFGNGTTTLTSDTPVDAVLPTGVSAWNIAMGGGQAFALTNATPPAITSGDATTFTIGDPGTWTVNTTGIPTAALSEAGALPAGVTFTDNGDGTGTLAGTPSAGSAGVYDLQFTATNGFDPDATQDFTLTVDQAPAFTSRSSVTFGVGDYGSFDVTTTGSPTAAITSGGLPAGLAFEDLGDGTATISGTPTGHTGTFNVDLTASNGVLPDAQQVLSISIVEPPHFTSGPTTTFKVGKAGHFTVRATGTPVPVISDSGTLPPGVTVTVHRNGTATLAGTPQTGSGGVYQLTFVAANPITASQSFTLDVRGPPTFTSPPTTIFAIGQRNKFFVSTTPGYPGPATLSVGSPLPKGFSFDADGNGMAILGGEPGGTPRTVTIKLVAKNGAGSTVQLLEVALERSIST